MPKQSIREFCTKRGTDKELINAERTIEDLIPNLVLKEKIRKGTVCTLKKATRRNELLRDLLQQFMTKSRIFAAKTTHTVFLWISARKKLMVPTVKMSQTH